jgi:hypothetical protein
MSRQVWRSGLVMGFYIPIFARSSPARQTCTLPEPCIHHPPDLIGLTCNETQYLFAALLARPAADRTHRLRWSVWRRR